jgi:AcrR family transcriptional regulator
MADRFETPLSVAAKPPRIDGRRLRSERTKQLIIEAYLALAHENSPRVPTAAEIAQRAGYSIRSVFERFPDIRSLQVAAVDYAMVQVAGLTTARDTDGDGDRLTRIKIQVETRARSCEQWLPLWRSLVINQGDSDELKQRIVAARGRVMTRLEFMYSPELSSLGVNERRQLLIALEALTGVESWARMREFFALPFDEACAVWMQTIDRLLPPTPAAA